MGSRIIYSTLEIGIASGHQTSEGQRANPDQQVAEKTTTLLNDTVRLVAPVIMGGACVNCHNSHPESPKRYWNG